MSHLGRFLMIALTMNIVCNLLLGVQLQAFDLPSFSETHEPKDSRAQKYLDFVKKDGRCEMAIAVVARSSGTKIMKSLREKHYSAIRCLGDVTLSPGTIQEVSGCAAFLLSPVNKDFFPLVPRSYGGGINMIQKKKCAVAFKELLEQGPILGHTVNDYLSGESGFDIPGSSLSGGSGADYEAETILLYSRRKLYTDWYFAEKKKVEERLRTKYAKDKAAGKINPRGGFGEKGEIPKSPVSDEQIP